MVDLRGQKTSKRVKIGLKIRIGGAYSTICAGFWGKKLIVNALYAIRYDYLCMRNNKKSLYVYAVSIVRVVDDKGNAIKYNPNQMMEL